MKKILLFLSLLLILWSCEKEAVLNIPTTEISISSEGGTESISISTNKGWKAESTADWCILSPTSGGSETSTISVEILPNDTYKERSCTATIYVEGLIHTVTITQDNRVLQNSTVLIYMAANNNLSAFAKDNLAKLKGGYVPEHFEYGNGGEVILVYYHVSGESPRLLRISKDQHGTVNEEILKEYDRWQNSADVSTLKKVLEDAYQMFPAEENGLFLWSHGTGWLPSGFYANPVTSSIGKDGRLRQMSLPVVDDPMRHLVKSFGDERGSEMEIKELAEVLPIKYSFILFDACLMGGIEVAYELKDKADYIISSTAEILVQGFPYNKVMTHIFGNAESESNLSKVCDEYVDYYNDQPSQVDRSATISLVKTSKLRELAAASAIIFNKDREKVSTLNTSQIQRYFRFKYSWFYDLDDYIENISSDTNDYNKFSAAMGNAVIYKKATSHFFFDGSSFLGDGFAIERHSGLSTYIPKQANLYLERHYKTLSWNVDTQMIK